MFPSKLASSCHSLVRYYNQMHQRSNRFSTGWHHTLSRLLPLSQFIALLSQSAFISCCWASNIMLAEWTRCIDFKPLINTLNMEMVSAWQLAQLNIILVLTKTDAAHCIICWHQSFHFSTCRYQASLCSSPLTIWFIAILVHFHLIWNFCLELIGRQCTNNLYRGTSPLSMILTETKKRNYAWQAAANCCT